MKTDSLRIERTNIAPEGKPPLHKIRLIHNNGDVLIPTEDQESAALLVMAMFDPPAKEEPGGATERPAP